MLSKPPWQFLYYHPQLGPKFIRRFFTEMEPTLTADLRQALYQLGHFFAHESCGKCYPCQMGTQRQMEILHRVMDGNGRPTDKTDLLDIGFTMTETSLCGLGQTAATAVTSAITLWPELVKIED